MLTGSRGILDIRYSRKLAELLMVMKKIIFFLMVCCSLLSQACIAKEWTVPGCMPLDNAYGPFDYTNPVHYRDKLPIVERAHFTRKVENLKEGQTKGGSLVGDIDYTLRAFPNHHRALYAMMRYQEKHPQAPDSPNSIECYFKRALTFKQDDGVVWMLYGIYNHKEKKYKEALQKYKNAEKLLKNHSGLYYNMGLLYLDMGNIKLAKKYAKKAYDLGYPLPALRDKLKLAEKK